MSTYPHDGATPNIKHKTVKMLNVAEDSLDEQDSPKQEPQSPNSTDLSNKNHRILDLTNDDHDESAENNQQKITNEMSPTTSKNSQQANIEKNSITSTNTEHFQQQASFVDLDYYAQIATDKETSDGRARGATATKNPMSFSRSQKKGNQILDDEEDDELDFDYDKSNY